MTNVVGDTGEGEDVKAEATTLPPTHLVSSHHEDFLDDHDDSMMTQLSLG